MTLYEAKEVAHRRITANTIAPGAIETDFLGGVVRNTPAYNDAFAGMTALDRVGVPDDIGPAVHGWERVTNDTVKHIVLAALNLVECVAAAASLTTQKSRAG